MIEQLLLAAEVVSALVVLFGIVIAVRKITRWIGRIVEGIRCHLRSDMVNTYYRHKDERRIRQYELENFIKLYAAYKALGGNSFIDDIYKEVLTWEIVT